MTAQILYGKPLAEQIRGELAQLVVSHVGSGGAVPCLAAVLVGDNPASEVYVRNKRKACREAGMESQLHRLPQDASERDLLSLLDQLNAAKSVHGILVQLPLPQGIDTTRVLDHVSPQKDVDCFHPENVGLMVQGRPRYLPCTPAGVQRLLLHYGIETAGKHAVIVGRSEIVGKPLANMLLARGRGGDATVTVCHSRSRNLAEITRTADILIAAVGQAKLITADMVQPGAAVIDVGINRTDAGLTGDVEYDAVRHVAGAITPVPGGVGPLTIAMLLANTVTAAQALHNGNPGGAEAVH